MAQYLVRERFFRPVRFWLQNVGGVGARDVYVDIRISSDTAEFTVSSLTKAGLSIPREGSMWRYSQLSRWGTDDEVEIEQIGNQKTTQLELAALQPQREVSPQASIVIGARKSGLIEIAARIYADSLPQPVLRTLQINWTVSEIRMKARQLLLDAGIKVEPASSLRRAAE
jgi:hypothetical protein